jgi:dienelactone hydrolase
VTFSRKDDRLQKPSTQLPVVLLAGCLLSPALASTQAVAPASPLTLTTPALTGKYPVGRKFYIWTDSARAEFGDSVANLRRRLAVWIYYPALRTTQAPSAALPVQWSTLAANAHKDLGETVALAHTNRRVHAPDDAKIARSPAHFPVVFFTPGWGWIVTEYSYIVENLASQGFVVVAINPTGFTSVAVFPDRVIRPPRENSDGPRESYYSSRLTWWVDDVLFVRERVRALASDSTSPFAHRLDFTKLGVFGHSFGGATAGQLLRIDTTFKAGANLDGAFWSGVAEAGVQQPFLLIGAHSDYIIPKDSADRADFVGQIDHMRNGWASFMDHSPQAISIALRGTHHGSFADIILTPPASLPAHRRDRVRNPADGARGLRIFGKYINAFFDYALNGRSSPLLDRAPADAPDLTVKRAR